MSGVANEGRLKKRIEEAIGEVTVEQAWAAVLLVRHSRRYCRSNVALYNTLNRLFPHLRFSTVEKVDPKTGETYDSLVITEKKTKKAIDKDIWETE